MNETQYEEIMRLLREILKELKGKKDRRIDPFKVNEKIVTPTTAYGVSSLWQGPGSPFDGSKETEDDEDD